VVLIEGSKLSVLALAENVVANEMENWLIGLLPFK
jgi:hypothetical protein